MISEWQSKVSIFLRHDSVLNRFGTVKHFSNVSVNFNKKYVNKFREDKNKYRQGCLEIFLSFGITKDRKRIKSENGH